MQPNVIKAGFMEVFAEGKQYQRERRDLQMEKKTKRERRDLQTKKKTKREKVEQNIN